MKKKVRLVDIAAQANVSVQHVSRALTGSGRIASETRNRITSIARQMGYYDVTQTGNIAVLSPEGMDDWNILCPDILSQYGKRAVLIQFADFSIHDERYFDGAIYLNGSYNPSRSWYSNFQLPLVVVNLYGDAIEHVESVQPDADEEMRLAVEHLANLGHRKIARLHPVCLVSEKRNINRGEEGFFGTAEKLGIRDMVRNVNYEPAEKINEILPRLLTEGYTAFIVATDPNHRRLLDIIHKCGKRIPEDVSLIVYEIDLPVEFGLTALKIDNRRVVDTGVRFLLDKIAGRPIPSQTTISGEFIIRNSTGKTRS